MSFARDSYTATGGQTDFTITFPYISETHVLVYQEGTLLTQDTDYTIVGGTTVRLDTGATNGDTVVVKRATSQNTRLVDYASASTLTEEDLDNDSLQAFYLVQEAIDAAALALGVDASDLFDARGVRLTEVADPTADQDAATKAYVDLVLTEEGNLPASTEAEDGDVLGVTTEGAVDWVVPSSVLIADNSINTEHLVNEAVTGAILEDLAVNTEHLAASAVTAAKIADGTVTITELSPSGGSEGQVLTNEEGTSVTWTTPSSGSGWTYGAEVSLNTAELATVELAENLPAGLVDIQVLFKAASTDANASSVIVQLGDSGGIETDGYIVAGANFSSQAAGTDISVVNGFLIANENAWTAAETYSGVVEFTRWASDEHLWLVRAQIIRDDMVAHDLITGYITLDSELLDIQVNTSAGTATFDGGEARVRYR